MNEVSEPQKRSGSNAKPPKDSIANTASLFGNEKSIEKVFKTYVKTGITEIDNMLGGGFTPGWVVLGAISNLGKSTFVLQLAANIAKCGTPVMFFSLEMPADWIAAKLISQRTFIDSGKDPEKAVMAKDLVNRETVRSDGFKPKWGAVKKAVSYISREYKDLYIIDAKSEEYRGKQLTAEAIRDKVKAFIENDKSHRKPFVIIDYLQIIPMEDMHSASSDMLSIDHNINILSKIDKDITVLTISSFNRNSYKDKMSLSSFKGSGTIEYSADVILGLDFSVLYENHENPKKFNIDDEKANTPRKVQTMSIKQRYNASGTKTTVKLDYWSAYDYFEVNNARAEEGSADNNESKGNESKQRSEGRQSTGSQKGDVIDFFEYCTNSKDLKKTYDKLVKIYHPDNGIGDNEIMKKINIQYEKAEERFK